MKASSYRDRDYAFGRAMLTLRSRIGLTQAGLADYLGVSRRAVGDWESGSSYPKPENLQQLIVLAVQRRAFPVGNEAEQARALWQSSLQKVLLDETWLAGLLDLHDEPPAPSECEPAAAIPPALAASRDGPLLDWDDAFAVPTFYGRVWELDLLAGWVVAERCRVVSVLGMGGIGKSALAASLMRRVAERFDAVIWRSLRDLPSCDALLDDLLKALTPQSFVDMPSNTEQRQSLLLGQMRLTRVLLVLDNVETVLEEGEAAGRLRPGYEGIGRFLRLCAETGHQSCVLLTSREKPVDLVSQEGSQAPVRALRLNRLERGACEALLAEKGVSGAAADLTRLIDIYTGNPLALKIVAQTIVDLFDGHIALFLEHGEVIFGGVRELLGRQFARLAADEQRILLWLAILREPASLDELLAVLATPLPRARLLEGIDALHRRSLLERGHKPGSFMLQSVVLEYATAQLITEASDEIQSGKLARLIEHGLELAQVREYVRQSQERLILGPVLTRLHSQSSQEKGVEAQLLALLSGLPAWPVHSQGYAPANLAALLRLQRGDLRGLDLSNLALRGISFQGVGLQDANLSGATLQDSVFTAAFDSLMGVAISSTGAHWAASSRRGEVHVWNAGDQTLHRIWQAHTDLVWPLAFSPDGGKLASGSWDGVVKLWDLASGALLWSGRHSSDISSVAYAPDGNLLASSGNDATIIWDLQTGQKAQVLPHPLVAVSVAWSPDGRLLASGDVAGDIRLWAIHKTAPAECIQVLKGHTWLVADLAFAPGGHMLASASTDGTVKLWDIPGGGLRETLTGHSHRVHRVAWSADGRILASAGFEKVIWLWDVAQRTYRTALQGHTDVVTGLAFTPDNRSLVSCGDGTLCVWDIANGRCTRLIEGNATAIFDVDWSPDGGRLVGGGSDTLITIYTAQGEKPPDTLYGHHGLVFGVSWSPTNDRCIASGSWDSSIRLWDPVSGECVRVLGDPDDPKTFFCGVGWSPDGNRLASAAYLNPKGVLIWDLAAGSVAWVTQIHPTPIRWVAWSPDGAQLAGGGDNGNVYLWDAQGSLLRWLAGHQRGVKSLAWSSDGTRLASSAGGVAGGELFVWDARSGERLFTFDELPEMIYSAAWGKDERWLISGGGDGVLQWWDLERKQCVFVREAHRGTIQSLRRSPDGKQLASCGDDGAIRLWDLEHGRPLQTLRRDRPYERLDITGIQGLTEAQRESLRGLGAFEQRSLL